MSELKVILKWVTCSFMLSVSSMLVFIPLSILLYEFGTLSFYKFIFSAWLTFFAVSLVYLGAILTTSNISKSKQ